LDLNFRARLTPGNNHINNTFGEQLLSCYSISEHGEHYSEMVNAKEKNFSTSFKALKPDFIELEEEIQF
jgi:hypothetical protein